GSGLVDDDDLRRHIPKDVFSAAILARDMFAARHVETAELVGFTLTSERGGTLYLDQISVDPAHGRLGLGACLVERIESDARDRGLKTVTLSTFRDLAWNGPFYRALGFRQLKDAKVTEWMREIEAMQAQTLDVSQRCFMAKRVRWF
ncbi:MAG: GNAT family N-acetyltransferase, partial [Pseudomonadota bacterium]